MRSRQGGTRVYCPYCESEQVCRAFNPSQLAFESGQRWYRTDHEDIHWFRRARECLHCGNEFLTAELEEEFLSELVELRNALAGIKENAEAYVEQSALATVSLSKLTESLKVLRALNIYRKA